MSNRPPSVSANQDPIRVLIVDDEPAQCSLLQMFLSLCQGIEVVGTASDGLEAIELCGHLLPDVIVMDYMMPLMNGLVATLQIRRQYPPVQVIILTAYHGDKLIHQAAEAGAFGCLGKIAMTTKLEGCIRAAYSVSANTSAMAA